MAANQLRARDPKKLRPYDEPPRESRPLIPNAPDSAATAFMVLALLWLAAATGIGVLWGAMLLAPDRMSATFAVQAPIIGQLDIELSPATVQSGFTNAVVFGWLSNAAFAAICFITPRVTGARLASDAMAFASAGAWNVAVAAGVAAVYMPAITPEGPLAEFPLPVDGLLLLGALGVTLVLLRTLLAARERVPYVSIWFFGVGLLAMMGAYALGSVPPLLGMDQTASLLVTGFAARAIATYWVLGAAFGTLFYLVPRATANPLASGGMAWLTWLLWAGFSGLSALGALVDPSVPYAVTTIGNAGTILLIGPAFLVVANLFLTMSGRWTLMLGAGTVAFAAIGAAFLLGTALLESIGALRSVQALVRNTEWVSGIWLWASLGTATFASLALVDHAAPRVLRRSWRGGLLTDATLWLTFLGVTVAGLSLMFGGIAHGSLLAEGAPPEEVTATLSWFWYGAFSGLGLIALGGLAALVNLFVMYTTARRAEYVPAGSPAAAAGH
ncbi:MAG TPA: cbb3-type cytochrome c oxidase subunit I [candidate division Zixibacteria bacterium]|nr:cbb3-type cytochrome c oxidase subunit I [candidate division Zixibacteria bacterium]